MITKVSSGLSKLLAGRFRRCDRFYAVRQFYAKAIFVMDGLGPRRGVEVMGVAVELASKAIPITLTPHSSIGS